MALAHAARPAQAEPTLTLAVSLALSYVAYRAVNALVPALARDLVAKGLSGRDMLKPGFKRDEDQRDDGDDDDDTLPGRKSLSVVSPSLLTPCRAITLASQAYAHRLSRIGTADSPEATGVIGASVYILLLSLFAPLPYLSSLLPAYLVSPAGSPLFPGLNTTNAATLAPDDPCAAVLLEGSLAFPHHSFATYLASLLSLLIATFLGFCDDVFDIRWRFKLPIPGPSVVRAHEPASSPVVAD